MAVAASSGLAFQIDAGASLLTTAVQLPAATSPLVSCEELGRAVGMEGLTCDELSSAGSGSISVGGPIFISTSGMGFGMGSTKYMGDNVEMFKEAVSTATPGLYTLQMTEDGGSAVVVAVASSMRVSIIGDESLPAWTFSGSGSAFTVAEYGHLSLGYIDLDLSSAPHSGAAAIVARLGGEVSIDQSQLKQVSFDIGGTLALTATRATSLRRRSVLSGPRFTPVPPGISGCRTLSI